MWVQRKRFEGRRWVWEREKIERRNLHDFIPSGFNETLETIASFPDSHSSAESSAGARVGGKTSSCERRDEKGGRESARLEKSTTRRENKRERKGEKKTKKRQPERTSLPNLLTWKNSTFCLGTLNETSSTVLVVNLNAFSTSTFLTSTVRFGRKANPWIRLPAN